MDNYIEISTLNDFSFCPYSIYLHNVYKGASEDIYYAAPQIQGRYSHCNVDSGRVARNEGDVSGMSVISHRYGLVGKIDVYKASAAQLIERKRNIATVYQGQLYQLWAQMLCMEEMGYVVKSMGFYDVSTRKLTPVNLPNDHDLAEFELFLNRYRNYDPYRDRIVTVRAKCLHCIYCNLCDKTAQDNVYA